MKQANLILLILIGLIGISNLVKVFTFDNHLNEAKQSLKEAQTELESAKATNSAAQDNITELKKSIQKYEVKNEKLELIIDSIALVKRAKAPKDWEERQGIKKRQEEISNRLEYLKQKDKEFE